MAKRRTDGCLNCGEMREIAAHGLCFTCYRRNDRAEERKFTDKHNPGIRREHKKILRGFTSVMVGVADLGVSSGDVLAIRQIIEPYLEPVAKFLVLPPEKSDGAVTRERNPQVEFTVHRRSHPKRPGSVEK